MITLSKYRNMLGGNSTSVGEVHREQSKMVIENTFYSDTNYRSCYIYDYYHDTEKDKYCDLKPYSDTLKRRIDIKFIKYQSSSVTKDQPEYKIQFMPSHKCELSYFDSYVSEYSMEYPIGLYIDIPDEKSVYRRWLICGNDYDNQTVSYSVLPCNYVFAWIETNGAKRILRKMCGVQRLQNTSGGSVTSSGNFSFADSQNQFWLPLNTISGCLEYDTRICITANIVKPITWQISSIENTHPLGITKVFLDMDRFNEHTDAKIDGCWIADYYKSSIVPDSYDNSETENNTNYCTLQYSGYDSKLKVEGSYKTITCYCYNKDGEDITSQYTSFNWEYTIDEVDAKELLVFDQSTTENQVKLKWSDNEDHVGKILTVKVTTGLCSSVIQLEISY